MRHAAAGVTEEQYPETMAMAGAPLPLKYRFAPGHPLDGLTLTVPLALLNQIDAARLSWLVPGMIREKLSWYLKALPKGWRNRLTPPADVVTAFLESIESDTAAAGAEIADALRAYPGARLGEALPADIWDGAELPPHLRVNVRIVDASGKELAQGRDLGATARPARRSGATQFCRRRPRVRAQRHPRVGFRRSAGHAGGRARRPPADRLSGAGRRRRQRARCACTTRAKPPKRRRASPSSA